MTKVKAEIVLFEIKDKSISMPVEIKSETVWLSANQMAVLFERDEKTIRKHINNVFKENEVEKEYNTQKMRVVGVSQLVPFYSLDVIISVGYRVKSNRGVEFRRWANSVLKQLYCVNVRSKKVVKSLATILVDYENVSTAEGLKGAEYLNENDTLIIFYSQCCEKIRAEYIELIEQSQCEFRTYKLARIGKNALDFYIAAECGCLAKSGAKQICIVSRDKGFSAVADFFRVKDEKPDMTVHVAGNIEKALLTSNAPEDAERKKLIQEKSKALNLDSEQARIREHREFVNKIVKAFRGTEYERKTDNILRFIEKQDAKSPRMLYTGSLHEFGREDGRAIYQVLKQVV